MPSEKTFQELSVEVYKLDSKDNDYKFLEIGEIDEFGDEKYQILKIEDNTSNGMQAMAVAPIGEDGKADTSEVVIAKL